MTNPKLDLYWSMMGLQHGRGSPHILPPQFRAVRCSSLRHCYFLHTFPPVISYTHTESMTENSTEKLGPHYFLSLKSSLISVWDALKVFGTTKTWFLTAFRKTSYLILAQEVSRTVLTEEFFKLGWNPFSPKFKITAKNGSTTVVRSVWQWQLRWWTL